jgi:hypothetical protein
MGEYAVSETTHKDMPPAAYLRQLFGDMTFVHTILVAAQLGIADLLKDGSVPIGDIAQATGTHARSLYRIMRALASRGVFREEADGRFSLTALAEPLRSDASDSVRTWAVFLGSEPHLLALAHLSYSVQTGKPAIEHIYGKGWFDYLDEQPAAAKIFNELMTSFSASDAAAIIEAHDFSVCRKIVDVGGGHGALLAHILARNIQSSGVLFDAPAVIAGATGAIENYIVQGRAEKVAGNFFEAVPSGGDAYVLRNIVHDWDDDQVILILKNCRRAMAENGRVLIVEMVIPEGNAPSPGKFADLTMLMYLHGCERTEAEYRDLLQQAGLELVKITPTVSQFSIIEGAPL